MKHLLVLNPEKATEKEVKNYAILKAARAIIIDRDGKIALSHVVRANYYKLPGGGVEVGEDIIAALKRECKEEAGSTIEVISEIGSVVEYRKIFGLKQISYCFLAKLKGKKEAPEFTKEEIDSGFETVWMFFEDAGRAMAESNAVTLESRAYIIPRDTAFLEAAGPQIKKLL